MFIDASAMIAILAAEAERDELAARLDEAEDRLWSAMSCWETVNALRRFRQFDVVQARIEVEAFAQARRLSLVHIGDFERRGALDAYERYGKGRHPARLNMGDCFAYACAKANDAALLYKGDAFALTDLA